MLRHFDEIPPDANLNSCGHQTPYPGLEYRIAQPHLKCMLVRKME